ncbi:hypothetical protein HGA88_00650 [Candidatus Roizmanbacteria bacterium]|nr:hypothetical protein [Candidatus Roizmanbacteria bacterium]
MRNFFGIGFIVIALLITGGYFWYSNSLSAYKKSVQKKYTKTEISIAPSVTNAPIKSLKKTLFVPEWTCEQADHSSIPEVDRIVYFGISVTTQGVNEHDSGYANISSCLKRFPQEITKLIGVKMLDTDVNTAILKNKEMQHNVIKNIVDFTKNQGVNGVALDLEMSGIFYEQTAQQITSFIEEFRKETKQAGLTLAVTAYGDTYYRKRPYEIATISSSVDEVMVMAYDFHKSRGEPGPNFPLEGKDTYGYDFQTMTEDFLRDVPQEKLTIIFGMYGYDWVVDENKKPLKVATAVTDNQVKLKFLDTCQWKNCIVRPDDKAAETEVNYIDESLRYHIVWFEDVLTCPL